MPTGPPRPRWAERVVDLSVGLSVASWGVACLLRIGPDGGPTLPRVVLGGLQLVVGALIVARRPLLGRATPRELAAALPSFLLGGLAVSLARPLETWPPVGEVLFAAGGLGAVCCLATLGRAFAVLPGARGVVGRGPYAVVRHPAYACELLMVAGCAVAIGLPWGPAIALGAIPLLVLRIRAEERPLMDLEAYRAYAERVRWRLLPGVY